jgi:hypothetical protein
MSNALQVQSAAQPMVKDTDSFMDGTVVASTNASLKEYFDAEGLMIPIETIIGKCLINF